MKIEKVKIDLVKNNPDNPRIIKNEKFKKLVKSIKEFPEMLQLRPIVVNEEMVVLGGNMRLKACKEAGLKEVPVIKANDLTEEQQKEFIIKDNISAGEWDWDILANEWELTDLKNWDATKFGDNDFQPNINPEYSHTDVTPEQVRKTSEELSNKFTEEQKQTVVTCPYCAETFGIKD